jgi:hypothetical protein
VFNMRRREFITLLGGAAAAWPLAARAQQPGKLKTIGYMGSTTPSAQSPWTTPFFRRLRELGWIEGRNLAIEYRWAEGRNDRLAEIAAAAQGGCDCHVLSRTSAVARQHREDPRQRKRPSRLDGADASKRTRRPTV